MLSLSVIHNIYIHISSNEYINEITGLRSKTISLIVTKKELELEIKKRRAQN
jgi:hypothetical protein